MSDLKDFGYSHAKAAKFNARAAKKLGFEGTIPAKALELEPGLLEPVGSVEFAEAVHDIQRRLFEDDEDFDGKLGRGTWRAMLSKFDPVTSNYLVYNGRRLPLPIDRGYEVIAFDARGGLDLHREADFYRGRHKSLPLRGLGLHWAGGIFTAKRLFSIFENAVFNEEGVIIEDPRNVSSHGAIELGKDGIVRVYLWIDLFHRTWHGGKMNNMLDGFDLLWDPREKYLKRLLGWGFETYMKKNPTSPRRGPRHYCALDPRLLIGTRNFCLDFLAALELGPPLIPLGVDGLQEAGLPFDGVIEAKAFKDGRLKANLVPHSSASAGKSDIACYMWDLFPEFFPGV